MNVYQEVRGDGGEGLKGMAGLEFRKRKELVQFFSDRDDLKVMLVS